MKIQKEDNGTVTDDTGMPLPGVNILEQGTTNGVQTDFDGNYSIAVPEGAVLVFSYIGMKTVEQTVGAQSTIDLAMVEDSAQLDEVVVTALGISREKKSLGYANTVLEAKGVNRAPSESIANQLSGKVAGLQIRQNNNMGGSSKVVIRGNTSLTGNNQALWVVDGIPINNTNYNSSEQQSGVAGYDYGDMASDIDPNVIESVNVLKGAAATALYGSRASNGALIITTKKGTDGEFELNLGSGVSVGFIDKSTFIRYQRDYGGGYGRINGPARDGFFNQVDMDGDGTLDLVTPYTQYASFGAPYDPNLNVYQWDSTYPESPVYGQATPWVYPKNDPLSFYNNPITYTNNISLRGGSETSGYRLSYNKLSQEGLMPNSNLNKNSFSLNVSQKFFDALNVTSSANYVVTDAKGRNETGANSKGNPTATFRKWWQSNIDVKDLEKSYRLSGRNILPFPGGSINNPYWNRYENYQSDKRKRFYGNLGLNYSLTDWLEVTGRISVDTYAFLQEERINNGSTGIPMYSRNNIDFMETNYDLMFNYYKNLGTKFNLNGVFGVNIRRTDVNSIFAMTNGGLIVDGLFSLSNSINVPDAPVEVSEKEGVDGIYGTASFGYDNMLYLDLTARSDHSSTLPKDNSTYFYPSVAASFIFSELFESSKLTFGKLRLNYAEVGSSAPVNSLFDILHKPSPYGSAPLYSINDVKNNNSLLPERTASYEAGLEASFFQRRLSMDFSYYHTKTSNQIMPVAVSRATGYSAKFVNSGEIENKGIELQFSGMPIRKDDFIWEVTMNWSRNRNKVLSLYEGVDNLQLAAFNPVTLNATVGEPYGTIKGTDFIYLNGKRVINQTTGEYEKTTSSNHTIGNINADWNAGLTNSFQYKNINFSFLIDVRKGGQFWSDDTQGAYRSGLITETTGTNHLGNPVRDPLSQGGGIILNGTAIGGHPI